MRRGNLAVAVPLTATVCTVPNPGTFHLPGRELGQSSSTLVFVSCSRVREALQGTLAGLWRCRGKALRCVGSSSCPNPTRVPAQVFWESAQGG